HFCPMRSFNHKIPAILLIIFIIYISFILLFLTFFHEATDNENTTIISHIFAEKPLILKHNEHLIITVKTSYIYYTTRLKFILETWYRLAPAKIFFVSDRPDSDLHIDLHGHFLYTDCGSSHQRVHLVCKLYAELEVYFKARADWSCHFDDDNYVNVPNLETFLASRDPNLPLYFGKISVAKNISVVYRSEPISFEFGTGGAGFCLSRRVVEELHELTKKNISVLSISSDLGLTDDVSLGFIIGESPLLHPPSSLLQLTLSMFL
ncbi:hypothetical protein PMAYCL1PPCAC_06417, partial [Pristionchus mayeri]